MLPCTSALSIENGTVRGGLPRLLRVGVVATDGRVFQSSQGFHVRAQYLMQNVNKKVYQNVNFTVRSLHGIKNGFHLGGVKCNEFDVFIHHLTPWFVGLLECTNASHIYDPDDNGFAYQDYYKPESWIKNKIDLSGRYYAETRFTFAGD
jgi:hypothetical protein